MKLGYPFPLRRKTIDETISNGPDRSTEIDFQNKKNMKVPIVTLSIELPKYRLANGRTFDVQAEYLAKNPELPNDFFEKDPESENVQTIQHELLCKLIKKKELLEYMSTHEQTENLILNNDGFVINGNRRLCAMRKLLEDDPVKYKHFKNPDFIILPPSSEEDIDDLEARLQEHPDIKAPYTWTSRVLMYKKKKETKNYTNEQLADKYDTTVPEIELLELMLASADRYLDKRGISRMYYRLSEDQYSFRQIALNRPKVKDPVDRDLFEGLSFTLIENASTVGGRVYEKIPGVLKNLDKIKIDVKREFKERISKDKKTNKLEKLGELLGDSDNLGSVIDDPDNSEEIKNIIIEVFESERSKKKDDKRRNAALYLIETADKSLKDAVKKLNSLGPGPTKIEKITVCSNSIESNLKIIRKWLSDNSNS